MVAAPEDLMGRDAWRCPAALDFGGLSVTSARGHRLSRQG
jgi:hypothetical protein